MDLVQHEQPDNSTAFSRMADRIKHNTDAKFGGAAVLVPPGSDIPIEFLFLASEEPVVFWASLQSLVEQKLSELETLSRKAGFGR